MATKQSQRTPTGAMTPPEFAVRLRVSVHKVHAWIDSGELAALNVATSTAKRPQYIIMPEAVADFEHRRRGGKKKAATSRKSRRRAAGTSARQLLRERFGI